MTAMLSVRALTRIYPSPGGDVRAVDGVDLDVEAGELVVIRGRSGAGKSTLLMMLGALERPTSGSVIIDGTEVSAARADVSSLLGESVASIFQTSGLIPVLSAAENVEVPLRVRRTPVAERTQRVAQALAEVGLAGHAAQRPGELSGGQQQRVGIARALVMNPKLLLADEPTAQLDSETGVQIMDLIARLVRERGTAAIVATHDPAMMSRADRILELHDGKLTQV